MTLSVSIATPDSIWILTDRRLIGDGDEPSTDASKIVGFDANDGVGLVCYAGSSAFADASPADWIASVFEGLDTDLRGHMVALAEAAALAVPISVRTEGPGHLFVAAGVADGQPVIYSLTADDAGRLTLNQRNTPYAYMLAGAGGVALGGIEEKLTEDGREILDWIKKAEAEDAHPREATDRLVKWTGAARREIDGVGARSIVAYRFVRDGESAAGRLFHDGNGLEAPDVQLHHISRGIDVNAMLDLMKREAMGQTLSLKETAKLIAYKRRKRAEE